MKHVPDGRRYIFTPATPKRDASEEALRTSSRPFFEGSAEAAVTASLPRLSAAETKRIKALFRVRWVNRPERVPDTLSAQPALSMTSRPRYRRVSAHDAAHARGTKGDLIRK